VCLNFRQCNTLNPVHTASPYAHVRQCTATYGIVRHHTLTQNTAYAKLYATYRCCQSAIFCCRPSSYNDGRQHNATCSTNQAELDLYGMLRPSTYDDAVCVCVYNNNNNNNPICKAPECQNTSVALVCVCEALCV